MRALPLWPEWAYMVVTGVKAIETRSRPIRTIVGERIVVHATKTGPTPRGWPWSEYGLGDAARGALVGTVRVIDCVEMTPVYVRHMRERWPREHALGDYRPGRWAFALRDPVRFPVPVPWRGSQGVFMVPDEVVRTASCERCLGRGTVTLPTGCFSGSIQACPGCRAGVLSNTVTSSPFTVTLP